MLTDMHCHLQDPKLFSHLPEILQKAEKKGVKEFLCCGTSEKDWPDVLYLSENYPNIIPAVGVHPWNANSFSSDNMEKFLAKHKNCLVGEIGLDLHFCKESIALQKNIFLAQLDLAKKYNRSVCIHNLKAWHLLLPIIKKFPHTKIMFHSYSGSLEITGQLVAQSNIYFSFSGTLLNNSNKSFEKIIGIIPLNRLLIETDSPYLLPQDSRIENKKYNEPANLILILEKIAQIKKLTTMEMQKKLTENSKSFISRTN